VWASLSLEHSPSSLERARQFTQETLGAWGLDRLTDVACLVVEELVINAYVHAKTAMTVELQNPDGGVRISVRDGASLSRLRRKQRMKVTPGGGLAMVTDLASDWGVEPTGGGKLVWALITHDLASAHTSPWREAFGRPDRIAISYRGFRVYMIDEPSPEPQNVGRAIVTAPDGSRAWLVWEAKVWRRYLRELRPPDEQRWGAWSIGLRLPMTDGRAYFLAAIKELRPRWEAWRQERT
jgi:hypothetical protein